MEHLLVKYQKRKGTQWERDSTELLNTDFPKTWRRIPLSGAAGTILGISELKPDLVGKYEHMDIRMAGEAKVGYGGATQLTVKRKWLEKIAEQAEEMYAIPMLVLKFSGSRSDIQHFVALSFQAWDQLMHEYDKLYRENVRLWENLGSQSSQNGND